jgi:serine/threonine protein kinase/tetratricopeptide (TPR) repeat protein
MRENIDSLSASLSDQVEMLAGELRSRWKSGKRVGVEQLGSAFESVAKNEEQLLDLIYHEVLIREEFGEKPKLVDFAARFPGHVERLQRLFAVHGALEDDNWDKELDSALAGDAATMMPGPADGNEPPSFTELGDSGSRKKTHWPRKSRGSRPVEPPPGYELLEEIGRGGMAVVFRAKQQILNRTVALKMLLAGGVASKEVLARIQQEAQAVAQLQHPGIVQIHEVGEHRGLPYLSLEYVAGGTLHSWLDGRPLPPLEAARIIEQLAQTTQFAHERGIVHRDLKPANVLLSGEWGVGSAERKGRVSGTDSSKTQNLSKGDVPPTPTPTLSTYRASAPPLSTPNSALPTLKISDFGLARVLGSRSDLTATGQVIGTPSYMAPEQAAGTCDDVSPAQDIYSLGAILYELLTGRPPFRGATLFDTLEQVRTTEAVPPRQLQPRVPRDLETICLKCLEKSPERRYATAAALAEDLRRVQAGHTITARPAGSFERSWKWVRRYPAIASLVSLTILLTSVGVAGIMRENRRATLSERAARNDSHRAEQLRIIADRERDDAQRQRRRAEDAQKAAKDAADVARRERLNAEHQRVLAEEARKAAEQQRQLALTEQARAQQAQEQAEASLDETMKAINSLAVLGASLRYQPGQQALSKRLYDDTLKLYENLAKRQGDNPAVRRQRIIALINSGEIHRSIRDNDEAEKLLLQAAELIEAELKYDPDDPYLNFLATGPYWQLGVLYKDTGKAQESVEFFQKDIAVIDRVLKQQPHNLEYKAKRANAIINECIALRQLGQGPEAVARYEEAIALLRAVLPDSPNRSGVAKELAMALHDYSTTLRSLKRLDESNVAFQESFDIRRQAYQRDPKVPHTRTFLARMYVSQGYYDRAESKHESSNEQFQKAVDLLQPSVDEFPDLYEYQRDLLAAMIEQLTGCLLTNNHEIGKPVWQRLVGRLQVAQQKFPKDNWIIGHAADWQYHWAVHLWEDNQPQKASTSLASALQAANQLPATTTTKTPQQEAVLANNHAWWLTVAPDPALRSSKKSVELARRAVELAPKSGYIVHTLGTALYYDGDYPAAREQLLQAIQLEQPAEKRGTLDQLLEALKSLPKDPDAALRELDTALGLKKSLPHAMSLYYSMLAMTLWKLNDQSAARDVLRLVPDPSADFSKDGPETRRLIKEARDLVRPQN